jgi:hypothetical protein
MRKIHLIVLGILSVVTGLQGCKETPQPEEKAALIRNVDYSMCGGCGGWFVQVDSAMYRADIGITYKENTPVWIRFKKDESSSLKKYGRWIIISSIRVRN